MLSLERSLIRSYRTAMDRMIADPFSEAAKLAFFGASDDLAEFIRHDGSPAEDLEAGQQFTVTRSGSIRAEPLFLGRLSGWARDGAIAVSPGYQGAR